MRIAFLTNRTTQYSLPLLQRLVDLPQHQVVHTFFYDTLGKRKGKLWRTIQDFGLMGFLSKVVQVVGGKARMLIAKRFASGGSWARSSYEFAVLHKLPYSVIQDINAAETRRKLADLDVDLLVVAVCKNILKHEVLQVPVYGAINIHPSLLPKYRGPTPAFWALYYGEAETGVTFHRMTVQIDEGDILGQYPFSIKAGWGEPEINRYAFQLATERVAEVLDRLTDHVTSDNAGRPEQNASYFSYPTSAQRRELLMRRRGG